MSLRISAPKAPQPIAAPVVPPAPSTTSPPDDKGGPSAQASSTTAAQNLATPNMGGTLLTGGRGVSGANVSQPGLTADLSQGYPSLFAKYLGD